MLNNTSFILTFILQILQELIQLMGNYVFLDKMYVNIHVKGNLLTYIETF